jgi:forkhead box protein J2/3
MSHELPTLPGLLDDPPEHQTDLSPGSYYPQEPNDLTGGLPINLDSLRDGPPGSKPFYPYSTLIRYAIKGSPNQKLLLEDIYYAIESRFPYFKTAPAGWKNSVRHNLSLNPCFEKVSRPLTDRGKGHYWTVNDTVDPRTGVHRIRKKKPKSGKNGRTSEEGDVDFGPDPSFDDPHAQYMGDQAGPSRPYPPPYPPFDPNFPMMTGGMRFGPVPPMGIPPDVELEVDGQGNVDWRTTWLKELGNLQQATADQDKAQADPEWYRMMLFRVRGAIMTPLNPADGVVHVQGGMPNQPNPGEQQEMH